MAKKESVVITRQLYWPKNPIFWGIFLLLSLSVLHNIYFAFDLQAKIIMSSCFLVGYIWTRKIMREDTEKSIGGLGSFVIDYQNIIITTIVSMSLSQYIATHYPQEKEQISIAAALVGIVSAQIITFLLNFNIIHMKRSWYKTISLLTLGIGASISLYPEWYQRINQGDYLSVIYLKVISL